MLTDDDLLDLALDDAFERRAHRAYCANPDPRDPDHPLDDWDEDLEDEEMVGDCEEGGDARDM